MSEIIKVEIPTDGTIPPCEICGSITVTLEGKPSTCPFHQHCPPCGGKLGKWDTVPQYCPIHRCEARLDMPRDLNNAWWQCQLRAGHEGEHSNNDLTFAQLSIWGTQVEVKMCVD